MAVVPTSTAIDELKLYVDDCADPKLTDNELTIILKKYALTDEFGTLPDGAWETFDMYGAAAECWKIKAGRAAKYVNINADGQQISLNQIQQTCEMQYQHYLALASVGNITVIGLDSE